MHNLIHQPTNPEDILGDSFLRVPSGALLEDSNNVDDIHAIPSSAKCSVLFGSVLHSLLAWVMAWGGFHQPVTTSIDSFFISLQFIPYWDHNKVYFQPDPTKQLRRLLFSFRGNHALSGEESDFDSVNFAI